MNAPSAHLGATGSGHAADLTVDLRKRRPAPGHTPTRPTTVRAAGL